MLIQNIINDKLHNQIEAVKAAKFVYIYINGWVLKYKWNLQEKKRQESTWITLSKDQKFEIEDANIESSHCQNESVDRIEV